MMMRAIMVRYSSYDGPFSLGLKTKLKAIDLRVRGIATGQISKRDRQVVSSAIFFLSSLIYHQSNRASTRLPIEPRLQDS